VNFLLDTNLIIDWVRGSRLGEHVQSLVDDAEAIFVSSVSIWEVSIKSRRGKLAVDPAKLSQHLLDDGFTPLPVTWHHAQRVRDLPFHHGDPFDRMLVAQAMAEPLRLLTSDRLLARYSELVTVV